MSIGRRVAHEKASPTSGGSRPAADQNPEPGATLKKPERMAPPQWVLPRNHQEIYQTIAEALGVEAKIAHISSEFIASLLPEYEGGLLGDKTWCAVFDNSKIKAFVPGFQAVIPFREGIRRTLAWFAAEEKRRRIDEKVNQEMDTILEAYRHFGGG